MKPLALYPGSFNPFHLGHHDIVQKVAAIFGKENLIIAQGLNPEKPMPAFSIHDVEAIKDYKRMTYTCFLHELIEEIEKKNPDRSVFLIRGIRNGYDLTAENDQLKWIHDFRAYNGNLSEIPVIYIPPSKGLEHISSSAIRNLESFRKGSAKNLIVK
jgi:pantetheine-phosphate adenylyltransferase